VAVKQAWDAVVEALATRYSKKQKIEEPPPPPNTAVGRMPPLEFATMKIHKVKKRLAATWDAFEELQLELESAREQVRKQALLLDEKAEELKELEHLKAPPKGVPLNGGLLPQDKIAGRRAQHGGEIFGGDGTTER
jgi:hypothetical protein